MVCRFLTLCFVAFTGSMSTWGMKDPYSLLLQPQCQGLSAEICTNASIGAICEWKVDVALEDYCVGNISKQECLTKKKCSWIATNEEEDGYCAPPLCRERPCASLTGTGENDGLCNRRLDCCWEWYSEGMGHCKSVFFSSHGTAAGPGISSELGGILLSMIIYFGFYRNFAY